MLGMELGLKKEEEKFQKYENLRKVRKIIVTL
jgi:hypothetical protein